jgi:hypothetical protein
VAGAAAAVVAILIGLSLLIGSFQEETPPVVTQQPGPTSLPGPASTVPEAETTLLEVPDAGLADVLEWSLVTVPTEIEVHCPPVEGVHDAPCVEPLGAVLRDVVVVDDRLVAVGHDGSTGSWDAAIFLSADGATWNRVPTADGALVDHGDQDVRAIATGGGSLVAVGSTDCDASEIATPLQKCPAIWVSEDGTEWARIGLDAIHTEDGTPFTAALTKGAFAPDLSREPHGYEMRSVARTQDQFVAVGEAIWTSPDGRSWTMYPLPSEESGECTPECRANTVVVTGDGLIAAGKDPTLRASPQGGKASIWVSRDGLGWSQVQPDLPAYSELSSLIATEDGFVAVGAGGGVFLTRGEGKFDYRPSGALSVTSESMLGTSWSEADLLESGAPTNTGHATTDVVVDGERMVAIGYQINSRWLLEGGAARIWASLDGGSTWDLYPTHDYALFGAYSSSTLGAAMNAITTFDNRLIVVGWFNTDAAVWIGTWTD